MDCGQRIIDQCQRDVAGLEDRAGASLTAIEDDGATPNGNGGQAFAEIDGAEKSVEVEAPIAFADDAELGVVELDLADGDLAIEETFLVVVDDGVGSVEE